MVCIYCKSETRVINSRAQKKSNTVWRRRLCQHCAAVWTSIEAADYDRAFRVRRTTSLEPFSRDRLFVSVYESLRHRKDALAEASALTATIISALAHGHPSAEINRTHIITVASTILDRFDGAAATHYRAFHKL